MTGSASLGGDLGAEVQAELDMAVDRTGQASRLQRAGPCVPAALGPWGQPGIHVAQGRSWGREPHRGHSPPKHGPGFVTRTCRWQVLLPERPSPPHIQALVTWWLFLLAAVGQGPRRKERGRGQRGPRWFGRGAERPLGRRPGLRLDGRWTGSRSSGLATRVGLSVTSSSLARPTAPMPMPLLHCRLLKGLVAQDGLIP